MTLNVDFDDMQDQFSNFMYCIVRARSQLSNGRSTKMVMWLNLGLHLKSYHHTQHYFIHSCLLLMIAKNVTIRYVIDNTLFIYIFI